MTIHEGDVYQVSRFQVRVMRVHLNQLPGCGVSCLVEISSGRIIPFVIFPQYEKVDHRPLTTLEIIAAAFAESESHDALEAKNDAADCRNWQTMPLRPTYRDIERRW